jgi:hypothetical protein
MTAEHIAIDIDGRTAERKLKCRSRGASSLADGLKVG